MKKPLNEHFEISEIQQEYIQIYHEYFVLKWHWHELCTRHNCSNMKISKAIRWVIENRINIPSEYLLKGAIDTIQERIKINQDLLNTEIKKKKFRDNNFVIALNREIREDEKSVYKLQEIIGADIEDDEKLSSAQVLSLIKAASNKSSDTTSE